MSKLAPEDIRDLLTGFAAAIELDQLRVDALPREKFHPYYDEGMWRRWRSDHVVHINNRLLPTLNEIPSAILDELTRVAFTYEPGVVRERALDLFADAAAGSCAEEELETAARFFGWLVKEVGGRPKGKPKIGDARALLMQWLPVDDPLRIAEDPECGYGRPAGFVN